MPSATLSKECFLTICEKAASQYCARRNGYNASHNQIVYFSLAAGRKQLPKTNRSEKVKFAVWGSQAEEELTGASAKIAAELDGESGKLLTGLKSERHLEWGAVWKALEHNKNNLRRAYWQLDAGELDAAMSNSFTKMLALVRRMVKGPTLDESIEIIEFLLRRLSNLELFIPSKVHFCIMRSGFCAMNFALPLEGTVGAPRSYR